MGGAAVKILIFGTCYVDTVEKHHLVDQWGTLHKFLNPECDLLLVDSNSPRAIYSAPVLQLGNNIGHLTKCDNDGWGRAFCAGLQYAIDKGYDYVAHIEGDSLLRLPVKMFCGDMEVRDIHALVCGVNGTKFNEFAWVETGIMFMSTEYANDSDFIQRYNWRDGKSKRYPHTPEAVIYEMLVQDDVFDIAAIRTMRDDRKILTVDNVVNYDWISHTTPEVYDMFVANAAVPA